MVGTWHHTCAMYCAIIVLSLLGYQVRSETLEYNFVVERKIVNMDGVVRDALTVNQQVIGPTVEATVGDTLLISVTNRCIMQEVISMHWHGINQKGTPWADGAAFVTNCPITHGSSYTYNFTVDTPGTYWYHVHVGSMREEGANGMIVVYSEPSADTTALVQTPTKFGHLAYDDEIHVMLNDRFTPSVYLLNTMIDNNPFMKVGKGDTIYINGKGESKYCSYNGTTTTVTTTSTDGLSSTVTTTCKGQREVFALDRNKTYLVRVVNAAFLAFFNLAIAGHYFTIVGVDGGSYTQPVDIDSLDLSAGQRVMALLRFNQSAVDASQSANTDTFLMRSQTDWGGVDNTHGGIVFAYVTYTNPVSIHPNTVSPLVPPNESRNWHEWYDLVTPHPDQVNSCPSDAEVTKRFQVDGKIQYTDSSTGTGLTPPSISPGTPNTRESWTMFNNSRLMLPATPYLLSTYLSHLNHTAKVINKRDKPAKHTSRAPRPKRQSSSRLARSLMSSEAEEMTEMNPTLKPLRIEQGDVVEVVVQAYASASGGCDLHPWHLHGHSFWLVSRGDGLYNTTSGRGGGAAATTTYVSERPLVQDTVSGYPARYGDTRTGKTHGVWNDPCGWFTIRFRADNPGMWLFHCHIGWHMEMGMALVFDESSELVPPPPSDYGMCGAAGEIGTFAQFATETVVIKTVSDGPPPPPHNDDMTHGSTFSVLVSFVVVLGLVSIVALCGVWLSRRHVNGMFMQINANGKDVDEIGNPLSQHALQSDHSHHSHASQQYDSGSYTNYNTSAPQRSISKNEVVFNPDGDDDLEEINFDNPSMPYPHAVPHTPALKSGPSFRPLMMGEDV